MWFRVQNERKFEISEFKLKGYNWKWPIEGRCVLMRSLLSTPPSTISKASGCLVSYKCTLRPTVVKKTQLSDAKMVWMRIWDGRLMFKIMKPDLENLLQNTMQSQDHGLVGLLLAFHNGNFADFYKRKNSFLKEKKCMACW